MEDDAAAPAVEVVKRGIEIDCLRLAERLDHPGKQGSRIEIGPDGDGPIAQAQAAIGDEHGRIGALLDAQPLADRAPAQRAIERKMVRRHLVEAPAAAVANAVLAVAVDRPLRLARLVAGPGDMNDALSQVECRSDRVGQPRPGRPPHDRPVDHHLDLVLAPVAQLGRLIQADRSAVDPYPDKTRGP